jgi:hypothetical protein
MRPALLLAGALLAPGCVDAEDRSTDFGYVHAAIVAPSCATIGCHSAATRIAGLDLSTPAVACRNLSDYPPAALEALLRGDAPGVPRMPLDVPLPAADIAILRAWREADVPCD